MEDIQKLTEMIVAFRDARDWKQFHNPKDLALSMVLEAAEVLEHFQWKSPEEIEEYIKTNKNDIAEEMADVFYWILLMAHDLDIDIREAGLSKLSCWSRSSKKTKELVYTSYFASLERQLYKYLYT